MPTTLSRPTSEACCRCGGYTVIELVTDADLGAMCQVRRCIPCGNYQGWGPIRGLTWPIQ